MGDSEFILDNLEQLTRSTVFSPEFVIFLLQHRLITDSEKGFLLDSRNPQVNKALTLYTEIVKRWDCSQYKDFKTGLEKSGNRSTLKVFLNNKNQVKVPMPHGEKHFSTTNGLRTCGKGYQNVDKKEKVTKLATENEVDLDPFVGVKELVMKMEEKERVTKNKETTLKNVAIDSNLTAKQFARQARKNDISIAVDIRKNVAVATNFPCQGEKIENPSRATKEKLEPSLPSPFILPFSPLVLKKIDPENLSAFVENIDIAWKLVASLPHEEIFSRITNAATRATDILGWSPLGVIVTLGDQFVPRRMLAEFRGKSGDAKGKTVFEIDGRDFGMEYLWDDLLEERERGDSVGCDLVRGALREALQRMGETSWWLVEKLEFEVRRRRSCPRQLSSQEKKSCGRRDDPKTVKQQHLHRLMEWITEGYEWGDSDARYPLYALPLLLRYCGNVNSFRLNKLLAQNKGQLKREFNLLAVLRSLVISSCRHLENSDDICFSLLVDFLLNNFREIPAQFQLLHSVFVRASREQIYEATLLHHDSPLVRDVSVWIVFLRLLPQSTNVDKVTWMFILSDVILFTPCCKLPAILQELSERIHDEKLLREILRSEDILRGWGQRFSSANNTKCGVSNFLSFYFSAFRLHFDWTMMTGAESWTLLKVIPLEIATALQREPKWKHLLPQFQELLRQSVRHTKIELTKEFTYKTEGQWERLFHLVGPFQPGTTTINGYIPTAVAAPLIRVLIKMLGVEGAKTRVIRLWKQIPSNARYSNDNVGSLGSLLHSAIELAELKEVKKRAWPGLIHWKNAEAKTALDIVRERYNSHHPIRIHLQNLKLTLDKRP